MAIKTKFNMKQSNGRYETYHFETDASQIITNSNQLFCTQSEKTNWNNKADGRHPHGAGDITALMSYNKPSSTSAITSSDSLLAALGKLERGLDYKASSSHTHSEYASSNHTHSGYASSNHSHSEYATSSHNHDAWYYGRNGGTINGSIAGNVDSIGEMHYKGTGNTADVGIYINADGRLGAYDWRNNRGIFQYHSSNGITDFSTTCVFHGRVRADGGIYMGGEYDRIGKSDNVFLFDTNGHWRNSQLNTGYFFTQPWSTEETAFCINNEAERTNGRTDLTICPSKNNYGILGRVNRYWYIGWATSWRAASYRESKYDVMRSDEERLYQCVKDLNIYNYRRISGNEDEERKDTDYRGDLQLGAMVNELPFEVVDYDTELGEGKSVDLYSYSSMIAGALKVAIKKIEDLEEKVDGLIQK